MKLSTQKREDITIPLPSHVDFITSPSNPFVKHCVKLRRNSSYRHSHGSAILFGSTPIREITKFHDGIKESNIIHCLLLLEGAKIPKELNGSSVRIVRVSSAVMSKLSGVQSVDSIQQVAVLKIPTSFSQLNDNTNFRTWFPSPHRILVLDGIQDPGNLGTLLRSSVAFGWDGVFLLPGCCDPFNDKAVRASRGASFQVPIVCGDWTQLETLKNGFKMKILAAHPERKDASSSSLSQKLADSLLEEHICLVLGSEGQGLSEQSRIGCELISIPMAGEYESLNVSVAGGIFLFMLQQPKNNLFI
ncbi:hypothetical protein ACHQM5_024138 [Ranunculus cassubicifolius]